MTDDAALFAAALDNPGADTPRLVLADWFDDHGEDELAWALRTVPGIIPFLHDLTRWDRMPATETRVVKDGRFVNRWESQYWAELLVRYRDQFPAPPDAPTVYDPDAGWADPGLPDRPGAGAFLAEWQRLRRGQIGRLREEAADAATGWRNRQIALPRGDGPRAVEERAVLLHELVIRGVGPRAVPGGVVAWDDLTACRHPLFRLPDRLLEVEAGIAARLAGGRTNPSLPQPLTSRPVAERYAVTFSDRTPPPESPAWAAIRRWAVESNGRLAAREFNLMSPHHPDGEWTGWFRALPFEPLQATGQAVSVRRITPVSALLALFSADHAGGAYSPVAGSAYPRLHAWESFAWLAGADLDAPCTSIADIAVRCRWYTFDSDWFYHVAWDLGLICIHPDGHKAAVLAATDTD
jgi:uncharacterized protein (TIGR02996 family)